VSSDTLPSETPPIPDVGFDLLGAGCILDDGASPPSSKTTIYPGYKHGIQLFFTLKLTLFIALILLVNEKQIIKSNMQNLDDFKLKRHFNFSGQISNRNFKLIN